MSKAIKAKFECNACGNIISFKTVVNTTQKKNKYSFDSPTKCSCGAKSESFTLLSFKEMESVIVSIEQKEKLDKMLGEEE